MAGKEKVCDLLPDPPPIALCNDGLAPRPLRGENHQDEASFPCDISHTVGAVLAAAGAKQRTLFTVDKHPFPHLKMGTCEEWLSRTKTDAFHQRLMILSFD
jgi:hypothetical protein